MSLIAANNPPPKPWERTGGSSGPAPFKPPSGGSTSDVVEASGTARPGEIVSTSDRNTTNNRNALGRPVPSRPWEQNYGNSSYGGNCVPSMAIKFFLFAFFFRFLKYVFQFFFSGYGSTVNYNSGLGGSGMYGSSYGSGLGGMYGGGMYGNSMYRGGYGGGGGLYGSSGMYGGYNSGLGGSMGGGYGMGMGMGMGMGGPYGAEDPNNPYGPPPSPPGFWISMLRVVRHVAFTIYIFY